MNGELRTRIDASCRTANEFVKLYYKYFDTKRNFISNMFYDTGVFVWNGHPAPGKDNIQKFFSELPDSEHTITTLDVQPIIDDAVAGQQTYILQVGGTVKYENMPTKIFQQSIVISASEDIWKIISDVYRLQDALAALQQ